MYRRSRAVLGVGIYLTGLLAALAAGPAMARSADATASPNSKLLISRQPSGEMFFALCLVPPPEVFRAAASGQRCDVAVLIDTSASQTGPYRADSIAALKSLLTTLDPADRVHLMAVDLRPVSMSEGFVGPTSAEMRAALANLDLREPLGSTDLAAGLTGAVKSFDLQAKRPRAIVYLGDGMSKANFLTSEEFSALTSDLVAARTPLHSYAIGPQRDLQLLAAMANHTGGTMYVDADEEHIGQQAGAALATVIHTPVFWPTQTELPEGMNDSLPRRTPPLRPDRESILLGRFEGEGLRKIRIRGEVNGAPAEAEWTLTPQNSADDLAYLPQLIEMAKADGGATLPTAGMEGLREVGRILLARAENLAKMGARELAGGDIAGAAKLIEAARKADPNNPQAAALEQAIRKAAEEAAPKAATQTSKPEVLPTTPAPKKPAVPRS